MDYELQVFHSEKFHSIVGDAIEFLLGTQVYALPPGGHIYGSGVYILYYAGDFELYEPLSKLNAKECTTPIYVGKAVPPGWRTSRTGRSGTADPVRRLGEHARSIRQTSNLRLDDFRCRFVVLREVESDLVVPLEAELIRRYRPLWNAAIDGFGNHDPGGGRYNQAISEWDVLHPGRSWVQRMKGKPPQLDNVVAKVRHHLTGLAPS